MMPLWNQYSSNSMLHNIQSTNLGVKDEFHDNENLILPPNPKKFHSLSYDINNCKVEQVKPRSSIGSCGDDDSSVLNSISTDGTNSTSNTPPIVYQSPNRQENNNINNLNYYQEANFVNSYYYKQNYAGYPLSSMVFPGAPINENPYQCYVQQPVNNLNNSHFLQPNGNNNANLYAKDLYSSNFLPQSQTYSNPNQNSNFIPYSYHNNLPYNFENIKSNLEETKIKPIPQQKTSSPIATPTIRAPLVETKSELNLTNSNSSNPKIKVKLQDISLWKSFNEIGTEMIITKSGRRMFPALRVTVSGLEPNSKYVAFVDVVPVDDNRYKYHNCEWIVSGKAEPHFGAIAYLHPDSSMNGSQWMKQIISFHKLKLTNNPNSKDRHIVLNSMHKYIPRIHIVEEGVSHNIFVFNETEFMAVTAYQNEKITKLKIEYNPFAKGFRDGQHRKDYRNTNKRNSDEHNSENLIIQQSQQCYMQQQQQQQNYNHLN